ncbi:MAG: Crp/Fnr family transcriptional regulator [Solirubrobacterales bacterium]|nr:Crp/Fnr family transcriptional regulator [Solirubrobacterales bacterium]
MRPAKGSVVQERTREVRLAPMHAPPSSASARSPGESLLDLVPELGDQLPAAEHAAVRRGTPVQTVAVPPGPWDPMDLVGPDGAIGFLVAEGAVVRDVLLAGSVASDLLGPGDVAGLGVDEAALVPAEIRWTVSAPARIAVVDARLLAGLEVWPAVTARLLSRATRQTSTLAVQRAISQLPRVDQRLLALFWHLAERWGRVGRDGIVVRLALTHETLGRMVGARRPTVSLALKELATEGTVVRRLDGAWVLRREGLDRLEPEHEGAGWQPPDASVLPDLHVSPGSSPRITLPVAPGEDLRGRLRQLGGSYVEQERRVREVLERCAATREELIRSRQRREEAALRVRRAPPR